MIISQVIVNRGKRIRMLGIFRILKSHNLIVIDKTLWEEPCPYLLFGTHGGEEIVRELALFQLCGIFDNNRYLGVSVEVEVPHKQSLHEPRTVSKLENGAWTHVKHGYGHFVQNISVFFAKVKFTLQSGHRYLYLLINYFLIGKVLYDWELNHCFVGVLTALLLSHLNVKGRPSAFGFCLCLGLNPVRPGPLSTKTAAPHAFWFLGHIEGWLRSRHLQVVLTPTFPTRDYWCLIRLWIHRHLHDPRLSSTRLASIEDLRSLSSTLLW